VVNGLEVVNAQSNSFSDRQLRLGCFVDGHTTMKANVFEGMFHNLVAMQAK